MMDKDIKDIKDIKDGSNLISGILGLVSSNIVDDLLGRQSNVEIEQINSPVIDKISDVDLNSEHHILVDDTDNLDINTDNLDINTDNLESPIGIRISPSEDNIGDDILINIDDNIGDDNIGDEDNIGDDNIGDDRLHGNNNNQNRKYVPGRYIPRYKSNTSRSTSDSRDIPRYESNTSRNISRSNSDTSQYRTGDHNKLGMTRNSMINKLNVLRISHPEFVTEDYTVFDDESLRDYLDDIIPNIHIAEDVAKSMSYMILGYIAIEIFGVYYLKMDVFDGFFKYNAGKIKSMRFSFLEMAEESYMKSEQGSNPLWMMAFTAMFNIIVFFIISIVNKMYGSDISPVIEKSIEGLVGGDKNDKTLDIVSGIMNIASKFVRR